LKEELHKKVKVQPKSELAGEPHSSRAPSSSGADGDQLHQLVRIGAVVFAVGVLCIFAAVIPLFFGAHDLPTALNVAAGVLPPLGFGLGLWGLVRAARRGRVSRRSSGRQIGRQAER
jgi:hypothetical protein